MELYIIEDYKSIRPDLSGHALTDALVKEVLISNGYVESQAQWEQRSLKILRQPGGKPVMNEEMPFLFSVSHTGELFACLVADKGECACIGMDIQLIRDMNTQRLAERYFSQEEIRWTQERPDGFFRLWARKEAYAKYTGAGLQSILDRDPVLRRRDIRFQDLVLGDGLVGCVCSDR